MTSIIQKILDKARWAPSGDNVQSWRFTVLNDYAIIVTSRDTRADVVYDYLGRPSQIALGALLETIKIAASHFSYQAHWQLIPAEQTDSDHSCLRYRIELSPLHQMPTENLYAEIEKRSVYRRRLSCQNLSAAHLQILQAALGPAYRLRLFSSKQDKRRFARIWWDNALIRLTMPEAYPVHKSVIAWNSQYSEDKIPDQAIGADKLSLKLMRWALQSWRRVHFMNHYLGGTLLPRLQLDLFPALHCGAHFTLEACQQARLPEDFVAAGQALQRFWLSATQLGLQMQPALTPLIFSWYASDQQICTQDQACWQAILQLHQRLQQQLGAVELSHSVFMGRLGYGDAAHARSLRLPLRHLLENSD